MPVTVVTGMTNSEAVRKLGRAHAAITAVLADLGGRTCEDALDVLTSAARAGVTVVADVRDDLEAQEVSEPSERIDGDWHRPTGW